MANKQLSPYSLELPMTLEMGVRISGTGETLGIGSKTVGVFTDRGLSRRRLELVWKRLEDAKQELDRAHQQVAEIRISGAAPLADGNNSHIQALRAHELAGKNYLKALGDLRAALPENQRVDAEAEPEAITQSGPDGESSITPREREVLRLIASGKSSKQAAAHLGIAFRTVVCHRYRLYRKLRVHTSVELTRAALRMGLIEL